MTTNYFTGHDAEQVAAEYLKKQGYKILEINWKTRYCEIDIIAQKNKTVYLTEVKYRKSSAYGDGLEYITPKKLKQMKFAAEIWASHNRQCAHYQLAAIEVYGPEFEITNFLPDLC